MRALPAFSTLAVRRVPRTLPPTLKLSSVVGVPRTLLSSMSALAPKWRTRATAWTPGSGSHVAPAVITRSSAPGMRSAVLPTSANRAWVNDTSVSTASVRTGFQ